MRWKNNKLDNAAHIKRNTESTSNEISLDVLDSARAQLDKENKKKLRPLNQSVRLPKKLPLVSLFALRFGQSDGKKQQHSSFKRPFFRKSSNNSTVGAPRHQAQLEHKQKAEDSRSLTTKTDYQFHDDAESTTVPSNTERLYTPDSADHEVARRKSRRRRHRRVRVATIVLVGVLCVGSGLYFYEVQQVRRAEEDNLDQTIETLHGTDNEFAELSEIISDPLSSTSLRMWRDKAESIVTTDEDLAFIETEMATRMNQWVVSSNETIAENVEEGATARRAILVAAQNIMSEANVAHKVSDQAFKAWEAVVDADTQARAAAALVVEDPLDETAARANESLLAAQNSLLEALELLKTVEKSYSGANYAVQRAYVEKRSEALDYAMASNSALAARDKNEAVVQNDAYNRADAEATALSDRLPPSADTPVRSAFERNSHLFIYRYEQAWEWARTTDDYIQDYLGSKDK